MRASDQPCPAQMPTNLSACTGSGGCFYDRIGTCCGEVTYAFWLRCLDGTAETWILDSACALGLPNPCGSSGGASGTGGVPGTGGQGGSG